MNFPAGLRDRRPFFAPTHYSIANYCTDTKNDMRTTFGEDIFQSLHLIPDPLMKNLADTIITDEKMKPQNEFRSNVDVQTSVNNPNRTEYSPLTGIANFISGVFSVISGAVFSKRKPSEFGSTDCGEMAAPSMWQNANTGDENKISLVENCGSDISGANLVGEMSECRAAVAQCQNKLEQVRSLLSKPVPCTGRLRRRQKRVFVDPTSVEDSFEDAFTPEDFETLSDNSVLEYVSPNCNHSYELNQIDGPKTKTHLGTAVKNTDIVQNLPEVQTNNENITPSISSDNKEELVASCEDKLSKLKALLQERHKKPTTIIEPEPVAVEVKEPEKTIKTIDKVKDKRYKNAHRCTDKRRKTKMRKSIADDLLFANEINTEELSSVENSPSTNHLEELVAHQKDLTEPNKDYFDEVSGRFHSTSLTESEDSFQIVFNDSQKRLRRPSDCDSEDSFIVFEESPDACYTTNDVFGDSSDSDSDSDFSDSGCGTLMSKLSHSLSKSVGNLTDDSLYVNPSEDEVDCARIENLGLCENLSPLEEPNLGLLLDSKKKELRKNLPQKTVRFSEAPPKVHVMRVWAYAARQARAGHWERFALDRERFKRRIADVDVAVSWVLKPQHRSRVMFQRFMPWWNAQKRKELAEKKEREALEKARLEAEEAKLKAEETRQETEETRLEAEKARLIIEKQTEVTTGNDDRSVVDNVEDLSEQNGTAAVIDDVKGTLSNVDETVDGNSKGNERRMSGEDQFDQVIDNTAKEKRILKEKPAKFKHQDSMQLIPKRIEVNDLKVKENVNDSIRNKKVDNATDNNVAKLNGDSAVLNDNTDKIVPKITETSQNDFKLVQIGANEKNCKDLNVNESKIVNIQTGKLLNNQIVPKDDKIFQIDSNFIMQMVKDT